MAHPIEAVKGFFRAGHDADANQSNIIKTGGVPIDRRTGRPTFGCGSAAAPLTGEKLAAVIDQYTKPKLIRRGL